MADRASVAGPSTRAQISYLLPTSRINRRYWAPGAEMNTGVYAPYDVVIHNARLSGPFTLDDHGFALAQHPTQDHDWENQYNADSSYAAEICAIAAQMTGADFVVPMGGMTRSSGLTGPLVQPPAAEAHVDFTPRSAHALAERIYRARRPDGAGYDRFVCFSIWRALSPSPQDMPLALCEGGSVRDDEGTANTKVDVDVLPEGNAIFADIPGEEDMIAATIFHHSPAHRWWYFPDMTGDEVILIKFYDSDHSRAWRAPHTAFRDTSRPDASERRSIEFRGVAYFTRD
jgi:hypothetical protein